jgi:hypothetical protein
MLLKRKEKVMRTNISKIIDGIRYDTEKAEVIASNEYWDGHNWERGGRNMHLYKTKKGRFFLGCSTQWQGEIDYIEPLTKEDAMYNFEKLEVQEVTYEKAFGVEPEEA